MWWRAVAVLVLVAATAVGRRAPALRWRARRDVTTAQGAVRGYLGLRHYAFLGIPYAQPPTHNDRFKAPEPPPSWGGIFEATYRVKCPQTSGEGDENCLVVNVFVPETVRECCPLPVLVHLHDGGFHDGWGSVHPPAQLVEEHVIVTFNYRVGTLGFLCLGTPDAPGNAGLKDQVAALHWVKNNIQSFLGNTSDITVYGTGAGATSVQLLILSGLIKGIVHRVILESGSFLSPNSMIYNPFLTALNTAKSLGYNDEGNVQELVKFYQNLPVSKLVKVSTNFLPCVESRYLYAHSMIDQDPVKTLQEGNFERLPIMIIYTNANEVQFIEEKPEKFVTVPENFEIMLPTNLDFDEENQRYRVADLVRDFYFDDMDTAQTTVENYKDYINDIFLDYPVYKLAILFGSKTMTPVYIMRFTYNVESNSDKGGTYGDIFKIMFDRELKNNDKVVLDKLMSMFSNFMKIGDPTPLITELVPVLWQPLNPDGRELVDVNRPCLVFGHRMAMETPPSGQRLDFWDHIYNKYYKKHVFDEE